MDAWEKHELLVLSELKRLNDNIENLVEKTTAIDKELTVIKVKSSIIGSISGSIAVILTLIVDTFIRR